MALNSVIRYLRDGIWSSYYITDTRFYMVCGQYSPRMVDGMKHMFTVVHLWIRVVVVVFRGKPFSSLLWCISLPKYRVALNSDLTSKTLSYTSINWHIYIYNIPCSHVWIHKGGCTVLLDNPRYIFTCKLNADHEASQSQLWEGPHVCSGRRRLRRRSVFCSYKHYLKLWEH